MRRISDYIDVNPMHWTTDEENPDMALIDL